MSSMQQRARAMTAYQMASETISPTAAIVLLYDGAIQSVARARQAIDENRIEDRYILIGKAHAILHGLQCQLDFAAGGEIAELLDNYYSYLLSRMTQINIKNDPAICDEIVERLREMRTSWAAIAQGISPEAARAAQPAHATKEAGAAQLAMIAG